MLNHPKSARRIRRAAHVPVLALLAAGAVAIAGCVSSSRLTEVEQERDLLAARIEKLQGEVENANQGVEALAQEKVVLAQEKSALATEKTALEEKLADVQSQENALGSKLREREEEARRLQSTYDGLVANLKKELKAGQVQVQ
jgi:septal ring factor EnvC (AmiA/AmiB activator)